MSGFTDEEVFLNNLARKSFLRFWSYPNLFRDQGDCNNQGDGKEICDLTVVFENDILLFSDKKIKFNSTKDIGVAWSRWSRKAIGDSVKQIKGARRWFEEYPGRIFLDKKCKQKIPISIPDRNSIKFHNIIVCHGIENELSKFNNEASFIFDNSTKDKSHWNKDEATPFCIGQIFEGDFVHIFNESTIALVLTIFDTAKDFIHYLGQRESLLSTDKHIICRSESDIIRLYYENFNEEKGERTVWFEKLNQATQAVIDMGGIQQLFQNPSYCAKQREDEISYFWDALIENFSFHILNGTSEHNNWKKTEDIEPGIRFLAANNRFERRILATAFKEFYEKVPPRQRGTRLIFDPLNSKNAYIFYLLPKLYNFPDHEKYREFRRKTLQDYCAINKLQNREIQNIFGIACNTNPNKKHSIL